MSSVRFATADDAEAAFYAAFERRDLNAMTEVWDDADDIVCVHPMGPSLQGKRPIHDSWRAILAHGEAMRFTLVPINRYSNGNIAVHHLYEQIAHGDDLSGRAVVIATNIYRNTPSGWRMVAHHGSPGHSGTRVSESNDAVH